VSYCVSASHNSCAVKIEGELIADPLIRAEFVNPEYDAEIDDHVKGKERLIFPRLDMICWWHEVFNRNDEEMNGPRNAATEIYLGNSEERSKPVLTSVETAHPSIGVTQPSNPFTAGHANTSASRQFSNGNGGALATLRDGIAGLGIGRGKGNLGSKSSAGGKQLMEVEMQ